jgi:hypothetical protein
MAGLPARNRKQTTIRNRPRSDKLSKRGLPVIAISLVTFRPVAIDDDNNVGSLKTVRDAVAASLGVNDRDSRIRWEYGQVESRAGTGTLIKITLL